jgi:glycosyltransferase involved in cell wall biosynthesis
VSRVLLVGKGEPDRGGIPSFLADLRAHTSSAHELTFLNVAHTGVPEGGRVSTGNIVRTLRDAWSVFRAAGHHDVVHLNSALAPTVTVLRAGLLAFAARARGAAVVVHAHGGNIETWLTTRSTRLVMRVAMWPAQCVVAVWASGYRVLTEVLGPSRVRLVTNGVDLARFTEPEAPHDPPRILYVGLLTPRKGVLDLVEASKALLAAGVEHELRLLGGTPDEGPDAARPVLEAADGVARLIGTRPPELMPAEYAQADVFCLPSHWEAMPLAVLEAMAAGLPVVATAVGEIPAMVVEDETGYVVPVSDPDALAAALGRLLVDPRLRRTMGAAGRRRAEERYSSEGTVRAVSDVYATVTSVPQ